MTRVDVTLRGQADALATPAKVSAVAHVGTASAIISNPGSFAGTRYGMRIQDPNSSSASATYSSYTDLNPLRGLSTTALQNFVDAEFAGLAGVSTPLFSITTEYARTIGSSVMSSFGNAMVTKFGAHCLSVTASDWTIYANNTTAAQNNVQAMCNAMPSNAEMYVIFVNEPDRDVDGTHTSALYVQAFAHFAANVKAFRGTKHIYPATAYTKLSIVNQANQPVSGRDQWNPVPAMQALGLDPAVDAVMAQHGYSQDPTDSTDFWSNMFNPVYQLYRDWGLSRMAFSEGASKNRVGTQFTAMSAWLENLRQAVALNELEFFVYYHSGGSGGIAAPEGWWIAGSPYQTLDNRNKIKYAQIARDDGV